MMTGGAHPLQITTAFLCFPHSKNKERKIHIVNSRDNKTEETLNSFAFRANLPYNMFQIMCSLISQIQSIPNPTVKIF